MAMVFLNYRVREQSGYAALLYRELSQRFGPDQVFLASRSISLGDDFVDRILASVVRSEVLLAIIGPRWLDFLGAADGEGDWVRRELHAAFSHDVRVIPVLIDDAQLPKQTQLPDDIAALSRCQSLRLRHYAYENDLARLVAELRRVAPTLDKQVHTVLNAPAGITFRLANAPGCRLHVVPGAIRRVRTADIWVNSENTEMLMARHADFSVSGIIRYWGSVRDATGRVVDDLVANELEAIAGPRRPVAPGTAIVTGAGALTATNQVRHVIHVAAVHGEPGKGYQQVRDLHWCVANALTHAERLAEGLRLRSVLFPLLGTGVGGGEVAPTAEAMVTAAIDYLEVNPDTRLRGIQFLGYNQTEFAALADVLRRAPAVPEDPH